VRYRSEAARDEARDLFRERSQEDRVKAEFLKEWQPIHFQMSGGTTGRSAVTGYTWWDLNHPFRRSSAWWYSLNGRVTAEDKWLNLLPGAPHLGIYATLILPLLTAQPNFNTFGGKVMPTEKQVELAAGDRFSVIVAIPSYLVHWLRTARDMRRAGTIAPITTIHTVFCVGEPITDAYRSILKGLLAEVGSDDVQILNGMSSTEIRSAGFYECAEATELHLDPEHFYFELLDPETQQPVPEGSPGVFVWSHIDWRGTVILRYWSGDYAGGGIRWGDCPGCKLTIPRLIGPLARAAKDFTKIRGARVELVDLVDSIRGVAGVQTFQVFLDKSDPSDPFSRDVLRISVAMSDPGPDARQRVREAVTRRTEVTPDEVLFEEVEEIEQRLFAKKLKAEWIVDRRSSAGGMTTG
jgi:phenylacetate-coenzyme A ligase PaaK-like adenylate-forming protein